MLNFVEDTAEEGDVPGLMTIVAEEFVVPDVVKEAAEEGVDPGFRC